MIHPTEQKSNNSVHMCKLQGHSLKIVEANTGSGNSSAGGRALELW